MSKITNIFAVLALAVFVFAFTAWSIVQKQPDGAYGSVRVGDQYLSTTTPQVADATNLCPARVGTASSTTGVLGAVNVTVAGGGQLTLYDATTTNNNLRVSAATSSLILADFPASTAGSYHFDIAFKRGLLVDYTTTGTGVSTTTISYRCEG